MSMITIQQFINEPWRDVCLDAEKRGKEIIKRNELGNPEAYLVVIIGLCDIINDMKSKQKNHDIIQ